MTLGVDVGGTFIDFCWWDGHRLHTDKVSTTADQSEGLVEGAHRLGGSFERLLHGTTVATNALLERRGARTVLVTDPGFEDLVEIGRQDRPSLYDPFADRPEPLVGRSLRVAAGEGLVERVSALAPEAVAIALRHAYDRADPEAMIEAALLAHLGEVPISRSSEVSPEFREFERTSTTVLNAYLRTRTQSYLDRLSDRLAAVDTRILVMRSSGGLTDPATAARLPVAILLSGPAGGVVAATALGAALGHRRLVSFDMGGTSTDVCRVEGGRPEVFYERNIDGFPCRMPAVAVHTVGAGGGSIGWADAGGALRAGPHSAGAMPGPAAYGRGGTEATVTDADLTIGRLGPTLAGGIEMDRRAAESALGRLSERVGLDVPATAAGVVAVVEAHMERAVRSVSVEQGADPRAAVLVAFGGAGGLHATALARSLDMRGVVVPPHSGVFSALGLLLSPPRHDVARTVLTQSVGADQLDIVCREMAAHAEEGLRGLGAESVAVEVVVDVRYLGQSHETSVPYVPGEGWEQLVSEFDRLHTEQNGFARPGDPLEVVTVRAAATGRPPLVWTDLLAPRPEGDPSRAPRSVLAGGGEVEASVWWRPGLAPDQEVRGPAVIEENEATTYIADGERARVHASGALVIEW